ncbi:MAG TPA: hypothetical protein VM889_02600 [Candidatus Thermoplasmatota archaeon]|nr:hypothetical protein [Candidatus Thermoplasmatota archaeon]
MAVDERRRPTEEGETRAKEKNPGQSPDLHILAEQNLVGERKSEPRLAGGMAESPVEKRRARKDETPPEE